VRDKHPASATQPRQHFGCRSRLLRKLCLGFELKRKLLRCVWQHFRMAAGRVGAEPANGSALQLGIDSAFHTYDANRTGQSGVAGSIVHNLSPSNGGSFREVHYGHTRN